MTTSFWEKEGTLAKQVWDTGRLDCPIYDMHGHMGASVGIYFHRCQADTMAAHLRRIGVTHLVFSHSNALRGIMPNADAVDICRQYPDLYRIYVSIIPQNAETIKADLAQFDKWAPYAVGLKCLSDYHKVPLNDKRYDYALSFANERGLPVLCHTWGRSPFDGGKVVLEVVKRYPNVRFFLGHCIYGEWDMAERCVKESAGNVYLELTAIPGERDTIEDLVQRVGSERLLFGTDMPWFDEYQAVGGLLAAHITEDDKRNILYRNAERILGKNW